MRVSANGGTPEPLTKLVSGQSTHRWPAFMPDGKHFIYLGASHNDPQRSTALFFASLDGKVNRRVSAVVANAAFADGRLYFMRDDALLSQPFDSATGELSGVAAIVARNVRFDLSIWRSVFTVSDANVVAYQSGLASGNAVALFDATGRHMRDIATGAKHFDVVASPDGKKVATSIGDPNANIWIIDLASGALNRLTFEDGVNNSMVWAPDGRAIYYARDAPTGPLAIYRQNVSGQSAGELVYSGKRTALPSSISRDGRYLAVSLGASNEQPDVGIIDVVNHRLEALNSAQRAYEPKFSPDGKWLAFTANEGVREEILVMPFPLQPVKWQVSTAGGRFPMWSADGKKLFFVSPANMLMSADVQTTGDGFSSGRPVDRFRVELNPVPFRPIDVLPDGSVVISSAEGDTTPLTLRVN